MKYKAIIFDFDGVILDTGPLNTRLGRGIQSLRTTLPLQKWASCVGTDWNAFNPIKTSRNRPRRGEAVDKDALKARKDARAAELIHGLKPLPGADTLIRSAHMAHCKLGVASSSHSVWVRGHLERMDLLDQFDAIKTADDVAKVKPAPDLYLSCLEALGVSVEEAVAIEDSPNGIKAAKAAGLYTIACPNDITRKLDLSQADQKVQRLRPDLFFENLRH
jgi:HAD superfamily hydrolase (TIGR01509 family)